MATTLKNGMNINRFLALLKAKNISHADIEAPNGERQFHETIENCPLYRHIDLCGTIFICPHRAIENGEIIIEREYISIKYLFNLWVFYK